MIKNFLDKDEFLIKMNYLISMDLKRTRTKNVQETKRQNLLMKAPKKKQKKSPRKAPLPHDTTKPMKNFEEENKTWEKMMKIDELEKTSKTPLPPPPKGFLNLGRVALDVEGNCTAWKDGDWVCTSSGISPFPDK